MKSIFKTASTVSSDRSTLVPELLTDSVGLTVLHPRGDDDGSALVDIITVHGLAGHPQTTWTNVNTEHYWPSQSLPEDIPRSRIMTFGYNTSTSPFNRSTTVISDISKQLISHLINKRTSEQQRQRPIIFVAHSLGGIVIKEFLHVASNTGHEDLADCVCGILFLGTPHKGSQAASFMDVVGGVLKPLFLNRDNGVVRSLVSNSSHLLELDGLLRFRLAKVDIYSFYELLPMKMMKKPIVERHSALLNLPSELEQIGLEADHRQMCKPPDRNHYIYETIAQRIMKIMNRQVDKAQYSKDLLEMTNKFAAKQMEHILKLTKELHEGQIGPAAFPMAALLQQTSYLYAMPTGGPGKPQAHGFEEILKTLPKHKVKMLVDGIRLLMDRGTSLLDLLLETERQTAERKAQAQIEAEREVSQRRIQALEAEISQLRAARREKRKEAFDDMDTSPAPDPVASSPMERLLEQLRQAAPSSPRDSCRRRRRPRKSRRLSDLIPCSEPTSSSQPFASPSGEDGLEQTGMAPATSMPHPLDMEDISRPLWSSQSLYGPQQPGYQTAHASLSNSSDEGDPQFDPNEADLVTADSPATPGFCSLSSYSRPGQDAVSSGPEPTESTPTDLPEGDEGQVLTENLVQVRNMVDKFNEILVIGDLVLRSDASASDLSEP